MALKLLLFLLRCNLFALSLPPLFFFGVPNIIRAALIVMDLVSQRGETQTAGEEAFYESRLRSAKRLLIRKVHEMFEGSAAGDAAHITMRSCCSHGRL